MAVGYRAVHAVPHLILANKDPAYTRHIHTAVPHRLGHADILNMQTTTSTSHVQETVSSRRSDYDTRTAVRAAKAWFLSLLTMLRPYLWD